ncbi:MAG: GTP-binding protein [Verrucomicrobia bacterium]|nr:GTP-binding protein [Verrucomicrobiota bacterium]
MKIPVTIVTGFLGSGKTTLICGLLKKNPDRRLAVLVNEFGEVSVDGALLRSAGDACGVEIHDLPNGCICCSVNDDFVPVMRQLQARKHQVDHVLIETSGLALPQPVMQALQWPEIRADFQLDAVVTVVDVPQLVAGNLDGGKSAPGAGAPDAPSHVEAVDAILLQQLENADVVVLNKIDELSEDQLLQAEEAIRSRAPKVRFMELAYHAQLDTRLCMGLHLHDGPAPAAHEHGHGHSHHHGPLHQMPGTMDAPLGDQTQFDGHTHTGLDAHHHGEDTHEHFHGHDPGWQSFVLRSRHPQEPEALKRAISEVGLAQPVLRAKGHAAVSGKHHALVLQAVRARVQSYFDAHDHAPAESSVVFIGYHPKRQIVAEIMHKVTGTHWE